MAELKAGDRAPFFTLVDQQGRKVRLGDFKGQRVLLYFYPKADTPGCTKQACSIRNARNLLKKAGIVVLGISGDPPEMQQRFDEKYHLDFALLSDRDHKIARLYGAWGRKSMHGKKYMGLLRSAFLIDEYGKVIEAWYKVKAEDTISNVKKHLKAQYKPPEE